MADTKKNYEDYVKGKAELKSPMILMDDNDKIHNFVDANIRRSMWVMQLHKWKEYQDNIKNNTTDDE